MSDLPRLAIVLVTYKRTREALATISSTCQNLGYPQENIGWYVADDGSPAEDHDALLKEVEEQKIRLSGHRRSASRWVLESPLDVKPCLKFSRKFRRAVRETHGRSEAAGGARHTPDGGTMYLKY